MILYRLVREHTSALELWTLFAVASTSSPTVRIVRKCCQRLTKLAMLLNDLCNNKNIVCTRAALSEAVLFFQKEDAQKRKAYGDFVQMKFKYHFNSSRYHRKIVFWFTVSIVIGVRDTGPFVRVESDSERDGALRRF